MLASGGHVKLGSYEYMIDEGSENAYNHRYEYPVPEDVEISGDPGKKTMRKRKLFWAMTDWSGGEGQLNHDPLDPTVYNYGVNINGRVRGQLTGRPKRTLYTVASSTDDGDQRCFLVSAAGHLCLLGGELVAYSKDHAVSWTRRTSAANTGINVGDKITAVAGDEEYVYYATKNGSVGYEVLRMNIGEDTTSAGTGTDVVLSRITSSGYPWRGATIMGGRLYLWNGRKLREVDTEGFDTRIVYNSGEQQADGKFGGAEPGSWWADCVATENSVLMFYGADGHTVVYEYKKGRGYPVWKLPFGFTCKSLAVQNGIVYAAGHYVGDGTTINGYGALYAMPLDSRKEIFVGYMRRQLDTHMTVQEMANGFGYSILFANARQGKIWTYDAEFDSISLIDDFNIDDKPANWTTTGEVTNDTTKIGALLSHGNRRYVAWYTPGDSGSDNYYIAAYNSDDLVNREDTHTADELDHFVEGGEWDFDFPMDAKALNGFWVTYKVENSGTQSGLIANQQITVSYALDGKSYETALGPIESSTTPTLVQGRVFLSAPTGTSTKKFLRMKVKISVDTNNAAVKYPVVYGVTAEAELLARNQVWDLILRTRQEPNTNARPHSRKYTGAQIRDYLEDLAENKNTFTFLDGYRYENNREYTTHTVVIEDWEDIITSPGNGSTRVRLREVGDN